METVTRYDPLTDRNITFSVNPLNRLTKENYQELAKHFRPIRPTSETTQIEVGYALGVQAVLEKLREGWVVGE